ncbi:hypothetical protein EB796_015052 [Bugula neritina]|uniref:Ion transport domain-containing protein n=1 Tax=Bugula neritina TaxID=10212 RepID=A0A7J7JK10_BUGNE|nr:hypothetical protein EB796_015052 [Bugula neritina]
MLNTVALAIKYNNPPAEYTRALDYLNMVFTGVFTLEFILKLCAFRFKNYFRDPWNMYDFIIVMGSFADIIISQVDFFAFSHLEFKKATGIMRII